MDATGLVDTGAILAMLDPTEQWHAVCVETFQQLRPPLMTSEAVLTELFYFTRRARLNADNVWKFVRSGAITLGLIRDEDMSELQFLMARYADRPMDFADATLVYLARRESLSTIFTVDRADFETYRIEGKKTFRIVPARR